MTRANRRQKVFWKVQNLFLSLLSNRRRKQTPRLFKLLSQQLSKVKIKLLNKRHSSKKSKMKQLSSRKKWLQLRKERRNHAAISTHDNWLTKQMTHAGRGQPTKLRSVGMVKKRSTQPTERNTRLRKISIRVWGLQGSPLNLITMEDARAQAARRWCIWDRDHTISWLQTTFDQLVHRYSWA